jgi:hypothetical protein
MSLIPFARFGRDDVGIGYVRNYHEVTIQRFNDSTFQRSVACAVSPQNEMNLGSAAEDSGHYNGFRSS